MFGNNALCVHDGILLIFDKNDFDILRQFPFAVQLNASKNQYFTYQKSAAELSEDGNFVEKISIKNENLVPSSLFCLSNPVEYNQFFVPNICLDIVPDVLANLKTLKYLVIQFVSIKRLTKQLVTFTNLEIITFSHCSLTHLPDLNNFHHLKTLNIPHNRLTEIGELANANLEILDIRNNNFIEIPILKNRKHLILLFLSGNPLKNAEAITFYPNLEMIHLQNATLTSIPSNIDQLQNLQSLLIDGNELTDLPFGIFNLRKLYFLDARTNLFSPKSINIIKEVFQKHQPTTMVAL